MTTLEQTGKTIEDATQKALAQLGVTEDEVHVEIIEEGGRGFLGIGTSPAKVRVTLKQKPAAVAAPERPARERRPRQRQAPREERPRERPEQRDEQPRQRAASREEQPRQKPAPREQRPRERPAAKAERPPQKAAPQEEEPRQKPAPRQQRQRQRPAPRQEPQKEQLPATPPPPAPEPVVPPAAPPPVAAIPTADIMQSAAEISLDALQHIADGIEDGAKASVKSSADGQVVLEIRSAEPATIIGKHGQTIDSIQYLVGIITNKKLPEKVRVVVDVEGYRTRREEALTNQAVQLASKVKETGEEAVLEPLHANERRIIHTALADDPDVYTYSEGEEPERYVVISPKK